MHKRYGIPRVWRLRRVTFPTPEPQCILAGITRYIRGKARVLVGDIARLALCIETPRLGRADQNRIIAILERLGWARAAKDWRGNVPWSRLATTDDG